ncbi:MAG TPA: 2-C-methyl-D-erythritol 2,4-cyclodiphosphate synthase, partial [Actinomycetota bacterium]|nr:2-C-methyl-D-erythritol 2,4-cyclodiphosphate synthase [Actinomycetota bacterium]
MVGLGFDVHAFAAGRPMMLGGILVDGQDGLAGHSDGDVVCHALADAMLGAAALGDLGEHFPDTDP